MPHNFFWIEDIDHEYVNGEINTTIYLEQGVRNQYREFLLERALFENEISFDEVDKASDYSIDKKLRKIYR